MPGNLEKGQKYNKISFDYGKFLYLDPCFNLYWRGPLREDELSNLAGDRGTVG
jgi:hypothetical protein